MDVSAIVLVFSLLENPVLFICPDNIITMVFFSFTHFQLWVNCPFAGLCSVSVISPTAAAVLIWRLWFCFHFALPSHIISASDSLSRIQVRHKYRDYCIIICHYHSVNLWFLLLFSRCCWKISAIFVSTLSLIQGNNIGRVLHVLRCSDPDCLLNGSSLIYHVRLRTFLPIHPG